MAPGIPQMDPQRASESKMTRGLRFSVLPIKRGSRILPTTIWVEVTPITITTNGVGVENWTSAKTDGNTVATIDPIVGM